MDEEELFADMEEGGGEAAAETTEGAASQTADAQAEGAEDAAAVDDGPNLDLSHLESLAAKRQSEREAKPKPATPPAPAMTPEAFAEAIAAKDAYREQVKAAIKSGDLEALAKLGGESDPAAILERATGRALNPDQASLKATVAKLEAEIAALKEGTAKPPEGVMTEAKWQEMQQAQAYEAAQAEYRDHVKAGEYPILSKIDDAEALRYGLEADAKLKAAGIPYSVEAVSRVAEQIAGTRLGGLLAQQQGATGDTKAGTESRAAADSANRGDTKATGAIDNRAASTTAAARPDPDDEEGWDRYLQSVAAGSLGH